MHHEMVRGTNVKKFETNVNKFRIMFYMYVLKSLKDGDLYIGSTNDLRTRFKKHNSGLVKATKFRKPFILVYYEAYASEKDARLREKRLKSRGNARRQLIARLKNSLAS